MAHTEVTVGSGPDVLAQSIAARLVSRLVDAQSSRGAASVVLTGGRLGIGVLTELAASPSRESVDWRAVDVWWGDERYVPAADPDRNDVQARAALLDALPLDPDRVHPFPASDGRFGSNAEAAAQWYADQLAAAARPEDHDDVPRFDVCMLGVGEEGHTASIFPESAAAHELERSVVAVHGCPKPPPTRLTLTFQAIGAATEVWLATTSAAKADAVALALDGAGRVQVPAAGALGRVRTLWLLDRDAAAKLPPSVARLPLA